MYFKPPVKCAIYSSFFRPNVTSSKCQEFGNTRNNMENADKDSAIYTCVPAADCTACHSDLAMSKSESQIINTYACQFHGSLRTYEDRLKHYKSWCMIFVSLGIVPFGLIVLSSGMTLFWAIFCLPTLISPCIVPLLLTITWAKCTGPAVITGKLEQLSAMRLYLTSRHILENVFLNKPLYFE